MARTPLADWLYRFRYDRLQKTQADFARDLGMSTATIQAWEYGRHQPTGAALVLLARLARDHDYEPPPDVHTGRGPRLRKE